MITYQGKDVRTGAATQSTYTPNQRDAARTWYHQVSIECAESVGTITVHAMPYNADELQEIAVDLDLSDNTKYVGYFQGAFKQIAVTPASVTGAGATALTAYFVGFSQ